MLRFIVGIVLGIISIFFIVQNTEVVEVVFFAWTISIPRALMLLIVLGIGIFIGWIVGHLGKRHSSKTVKKSS